MKGLAIYLGTHGIPMKNTGFHVILNLNLGDP